MAASRLAKLTRPRTEGLLRRERLFSQLDQAAERPVVWIAAPPGAGKTSFISSYLETRKLPSIWYQVDAGDADPATFFYYLGLAAAELLGRKAKRLPLFTQDFAQDLAGFSRRYFRILFEQVPDAFTLVLDNYQEAPESSPFHGAVREALEQVTNGIHVIGISRGGPPPELARLRAAQKLVLFDWDMLKLTLEETTSIASMAPSFDATRVEELHQHTNGWAAGLVLMLERLKHTGQIRHLAGSENLETVFDYFATQLFDAANVDTRDMLLRMSYLPRLTTETAQVITGKSGAGALLADLSKRNLFTDRRYGEETSFQFHALFRTFLQEKAKNELGAAEHQRLASSAAALLQTTGQIEDAFALYIESASWPVAARLITREAKRLILQGRRQTLRQWISGLPFDVMLTDPWLMYWYGMSLMGVSQAKGREAFTTAFEQFERAADSDGMILSASALMDSVYNEPISYDIFDPWIERLVPMLRAKSDFEESTVRGFASLGRALMLHRPLSKELAWCVGHLRKIMESQDAALAVPVGTTVVMFDWFSGDYADAEIVANKVIPLLADQTVSPASVIWWNFWYCPYLVSVGRYQESLAHLDEISNLVDDSGMAPLRADLSRIRALAYCAMGDWVTAKRILEQDVEPHLATLRKGNLALYHVLNANLQFEGGDIAGAGESFAKGIQIAKEYGVELAVIGTTIAWLDLLVAQGRFEDWERESASFKGQTRDVEWPTLEMGLLLNRAYYERCRGDNERFIEALANALNFGRRNNLAVRPAGFASIFALLFAQALERNIEPEYARRQIRLRNLKSPHADLEAWPWSLKIYGLGGFSVRTVDGTSIAKSQHKLLEVLKAMIAFGREGVNTQELADALWPDAEGDTAQNALQVSIHRLRKLLGRENAVLLSDGKLSLNENICWIDAHAFERKVERLKEMKARDSEYEALAQAALKLYRGHLVAMEKEQSWMLAPRERLRRIWLGSVKDLGRLYEQRADWPRATETYQQALDIDRVSEDIYRRLMICQQQSGDRSEALKTYSRCKEQLASLLNTKPSTETDRLYQSLTQEVSGAR